MTDHVETVDAVVIGANIRGLVTTYVLSTLGYRTVLVERSERIGGADASFISADGTRFDHGLHVLDSMRSEVATELFRHVVDDAVHEIVLRRGIVLRGHLLPYAPLPSEMPSELRAMLPSDALTDDIGDELPSRERLAQYYGRAFANLVLDEVLPSYPTEARHLAFGVDEAELLTNIYPWFFPRATRRAKSGDESREFHDRLRGGSEQRILYPREGGFGGFAQGFLRHLDPKRIEVITGANDVHMETRAGTHTVEWVRAGGRRFVAPHYFWAGSWNILCRLLDIPCQDTVTDRVMLGSFRLNRPACSAYHELLVGDPAHHINRIYFPGRFRESDDPLMQIEFAVPRAEPWPEEADHWRDAWVTSTRQLEILDAGHRVEEFDFRSFPIHFNGFGVDGEPLRDADPTTAVRPDSNIRPVVPSMANLNLNRYVPRTVQYVKTIVAETPRAA